MRERKYQNFKNKDTDLATLEKRMTTIIKVTDLATLVHTLDVSVQHLLVVLRSEKAILAPEIKNGKCSFFTLIGLELRT